mmetsp:Transcript_4360/g.6704  ORF Transcript_4360/g.6704 Transcript_4360/m.6704 type:complete len:288 (+) Transcript_4360:1761-2624(+)
MPPHFPLILAIARSNALPPPLPLPSCPEYNHQPRNICCIMELICSEEHRTRLTSGVNEHSGTDIIVCFSVSAAISMRTPNIPFFLHSRATASAAGSLVATTTHFSAFDPKTDSNGMTASFSGRIQSNSIPSTPSSTNRRSSIRLRRCKYSLYAAASPLPHCLRSCISPKRLCTSCSSLTATLSSSCNCSISNRAASRVLVCSNTSCSRDFTSRIAIDIFSFNCSIDFSLRTIELRAVLASASISARSARQEHSVFTAIATAFWFCMSSQHATDRLDSSRADSIAILR